MPVAAAVTIAKKLFGLVAFGIQFIPCFVLFPLHIKSKWYIFSIVIIVVVQNICAIDFLLIYAFVFFVLQAAYTEDQLAGECCV